MDKLLADDGRLTDLIRREAPRYTPPPELAARLRAQLDATALPAPAATARPAVPRPRWRWRPLEALGLVGLGAAGAWLAALMFLAAPVPAGLLDELATSHVRSLQATHLMDVASTDQHTVKPWFAGKLDFAPPVPDLQADGYTLAGGRLDYVQGRNVAALVYRPGRHVVNLFVWPAAPGQPEQAPTPATQRGFNLVGWTHAGLQAWAVSDMNAAELQAFAQAVLRRQQQQP